MVMGMETIPLAHFMMLVNLPMLHHRITCMVVLITTTMAMRISKMIVMMMTVHPGLIEKDATITTKMDGRITISITLMETFLLLIGSSPQTVTVMVMEIIRAQIVVLQNTIQVKQMETCSRSTLHNTKTKMVMDGVTTPQTPLMVMHVNGTGVHHGETAKDVWIPTLMALQTLQLRGDSNGMYLMAQMHGHLTALNGQIQMVMGTVITVHKVQPTLTNSLITLVQRKIMIQMAILTGGLSTMICQIT